MKADELKLSREEILEIYESYEKFESVIESCDI
jgi:hypothetical protein